MAEVAFDETIHAPVRLRICGLLRPVDKLEFSVLRDTLDVSDATLSKHLKTLSTAGYATADKADLAVADTGWPRCLRRPRPRPAGDHHTCRLRRAGLVPSLRSWCGTGAGGATRPASVVLLGHGDAPHGR